MPIEQTIYEDSIFYDLVHGDFAAPETLDFYFDKIERYGSPVLELACGSGAFLVPFAQRDIEAVGIDISAEMLNRASEKAAAKNVSLRLLAGDIRDFKLGRKFPLILLPGNSMQHLLTREDAEKCFASVKKHLTDDGRFIVEVFNPSLKILSRPPDENILDSEYETPEGKFILTGKVDYNAATQINNIEWHFHNVLTGKSKIFSFSMRQFFPQEFESLLIYNGFEIEQKFGDHDGSPFEKDSPRQIIISKLAR